jgi:hypothetical protein
MKKVAIRIEAMRPEVAPIKGDTGASFKYGLNEDWCDGRMAACG